MKDTISIVYIGDKPRKRDTITGSRLVFLPMKPVAVESDIAYQLLDYPNVWRKGDEIEAVKAERENAAAARAYREAEIARMEEERRQAEDMHVGDIDLNKLTSAQLKTLCEAEDLELHKGPQEPVGEFRVRVRDALRAKMEQA
ncbi:hypothetical protein [Aeromonas enteropelogenes]|uniref:hypothetical protein n=1 Tax=Aeromonas enteropelogenes TaxID=29489 RepID=UPI003B9F47C8